jgi:hypothetical protein
MLDLSELRRLVEAQEAELERLTLWCEEATTPQEQAERSAFLSEFAGEVRQARFHLDAAEKMRDKQARLQEHRPHDAATWGEVFGESG